jgi:hypothetical protein
MDDPTGVPGGAGILPTELENLRSLTVRPVRPISIEGGRSHFPSFDAGGCLKSLTRELSDLHQQQSNPRGGRADRFPPISALHVALDTLGFVQDSFVRGTRRVVLTNLVGNS